MTKQTESLEITFHWTFRVHLYGPFTYLYKVLKEQQTYTDYNEPLKNFNRRSDGLDNRKNSEQEFLGRWVMYYGIAE